MSETSKSTNDIIVDIVLDPEILKCTTRENTATFTIGVGLGVSYHSLRDVPNSEEPDNAILFPFRWKKPEDSNVEICAQLIQVEDTGNVEIIGTINYDLPQGPDADKIRKVIGGEILSKTDINAIGSPKKTDKGTLVSHGLCRFPNPDSVSKKDLTNVKLVGKDTNYKSEFGFFLAAMHSISAQIPPVPQALGYSCLLEFSVNTVLIKDESCKYYVVLGPKNSCDVTNNTDLNRFDGTNRFDLGAPLFIDNTTYVCETPDIPLYDVYNCSLGGNCINEEWAFVSEFDVNPTGNDPTFDGLPDGVVLRPVSLPKRLEQITEEHVRRINSSETEDKAPLPEDSLTKLLWLVREAEIENQEASSKQWKVIHGCELRLVEKPPTGDTQEPHRIWSHAPIPYIPKNAEVLEKDQKQAEEIRMSGDLEYRNMPLAELDNFKFGEAALQNRPKTEDIFEINLHTFVPTKENEMGAMPLLLPGTDYEFACIQVPTRGGLLPIELQKNFGIVDGTPIPYLLNDQFELSKVGKGCIKKAKIKRSTLPSAPVLDNNSGIKKDESKNGNETKDMRPINKMLDELEPDTPSYWFYEDDRHQFSMQESMKHEDSESDESPKKIVRTKKYEYALTGLQAYHLEDCSLEIVNKSDTKGVPTSLSVVYRNALWNLQYNSLPSEDGCAGRVKLAIECVAKYRVVITGGNEELIPVENAAFTWSATLEADAKGARCEVSIEDWSECDPRNIKLGVKLTSDGHVSSVGWQPGVRADSPTMTTGDIPAFLMSVNNNSLKQLTLQPPKTDFWTGIFWKMADGNKYDDLFEFVKQAVSLQAGVDADTKGMNDPAATKIALSVFYADWNKGKEALRQSETGSEMIDVVEKDADVIAKLLSNIGKKTDVFEARFHGLVDATCAKDRIARRSLLGLRQLKAPITTVDIEGKPVTVERRFYATEATRIQVEPKLEPGEFIQEMVDLAAEGSSARLSVSKDRVSIEDMRVWKDFDRAHGHIQGFSWNGWPLPLLPPKPVNSDPDKQGLSDWYTTALKGWCDVAFAQRQPNDTSSSEKRLPLFQQSVTIHEEPLRQGVDVVRGYATATNRYSEGSQEKAPPELAKWKTKVKKDNDPDRKKAPLALRMLLPTFESRGDLHTVLAYLDEQFYGEGVAEDILVDLNLVRSMCDVWPQFGDDPATTGADKKDELEENSTEPDKACKEKSLVHILPKIKVRRIAGHTADEPGTPHPLLKGCSAEIEIDTASTHVVNPRRAFYEMRLRRFTHPEFNLRDEQSGEPAGGVESTGNKEVFFALTDPLKLGDMQTDIPSIGLILSWDPKDDELVAKMKVQLDIKHENQNISFNVSVDGKSILKQQKKLPVSENEVAQFGIRVLPERILPRESYREDALLAFQIIPVARIMPSKSSQEIDMEGWRQVTSGILLSQHGPEGSPSNPIGTNWGSLKVTCVTDPNKESVVIHKVVTSDTTSPTWVQQVESPDSIYVPNTKGKGEYVLVEDLRVSHGKNNEILLFSKDSKVKDPISWCNIDAKLPQTVSRKYYFLVTRTVQDVRGFESELVLDVLDGSAVKDTKPIKNELGLDLPGIKGHSTGLRFRIISIEQYDNGKGLFPPKGSKPLSSIDSKYRIVGLSNVIKYKDK